MKKGRYGFTIIELMIVSAIAIIVISGMVAFSGSRKAGAASASRNIFISALTEATGLAASSGNGATIVFVPEGALPAELVIYSGQPNGGFMSPAPIRHLKLMGKISAVSGQNTVSATNFAIFIDGYNRATYGNWAVGGGTITIPSCTISGTPLLITYDGGTSSLSCGAGSFINTANGQVVSDPA